MKRMKYILTSFVALLFLTSCNELDLTPEDYYGSNTYWKNASQVETAMQGLHVRARAYYWSLFQMGELRGGTFHVGASMIGTSLDAQQIVTNSLSEDIPGISNWGNGIYYVIFPLNQFITEVENGCTFLTESQRNYYLGQAYGMRAFYYFMLYRTYGGVPLITTTDVLTSTSAEQLYTARSTAEQTLKLIKDDITASETYFGSAASSQKVYWTPNATQMLKGQVYLWSAKVATGDHAAGGQSDLTIAKTAVQNLIGKYSLLDKFGSIFDTKNKNNAETIFAFRFLEGEAVVGNVGLFVAEDRYFNGLFYTKEGKKMKDTLQVLNTSSHLLRYVYKWGLFESMNENDTRIAATFLPCYSPTDTTNTTFKPAGLLYRKTLGSINAANNRIYDADWVVYRYADVLLMMAEIENGLNNFTAAADYINQVRARAYGCNGNMSKFQTDYPTEVYSAGSFADNELAILHERDKEFVLECSRWFDVVRLRGADGKSICFSATAGYTDVDDNTQKPILDYATQSHMLLWPINVGLLNQDPLLTQTPGYPTKYSDRNK